MRHSETGDDVSNAYAQIFADALKRALRSQLSGFGSLNNFDKAWSFLSSQLNAVAHVYGRGKRRRSFSSPAPTIPEGTGFPPRHNRHVPELSGESFARACAAIHLAVHDQPDAYPGARP